MALVDFMNTECPYAKEAIKSKEQKMIAERIEFVVDEIKKMAAVETLEYLDKNLLFGDNKTRSEERQKQFKWLLREMEIIKDYNDRKEHQ